MENVYDTHNVDNINKEIDLGVLMRWYALENCLNVSLLCTNTKPKSKSYTVHTHTYTHISGFVCIVCTTEPSLCTHIAYTHTDRDVHSLAFTSSSFNMGLMFVNAHTFLFSIRTNIVQAIHFNRRFAILFKFAKAEQSVKKKTKYHHLI